MPSKWAMVDNSFPTFTEDEKPKQQVAKLTDYMFILVEELKYQLANLGAENWNAAALEQMQKDTTAEAEGDIAKLAAALTACRVQMDAMEASVDGRIRQVETDMGYLEAGQGEIVAALEGIEGDMAALQAAYDQAEEDVQELEKALGSLRTELANAGYATENYVKSYAQPKGSYLTAVPAGYATETYVTNYAQPKGSYLTAVPAGYATETYVKNYAHPKVSMTDYITANGTSGVWTYWKFNSGLCVAMGKPTVSWGTNSAVAGQYRSVAALDLTGIFTAVMGGSCSNAYRGVNCFVQPSGGTSAELWATSATGTNSSNLSTTPLVVLHGKWK